VVENEQIYVDANTILQSPFFIGELADGMIESQSLSETWIGELDFSVRFNNILKHNKEIRNIQDLLNTDYSKFLRQANCGTKTIEDTRQVIMEYFEIDETNDFPLQFDLNTNHKSKFLDTSVNRYVIDKVQQRIDEKLVEDSFIDCMEKEEIEKKLSTDLNLLSFGVRFTAALKSFPNCKNVGDVIRMKVADFLALENVGIKSVKDARQIIIEFLKSDDIEISYSDRLDERMIQKLKTVIRREQYVEVFLEYYEFMMNKKIFLNDIGAEFGVTRERIRQKIAKVSVEINKNSYILKDLVNSLKEFGYIFKLESFYQHIVQQRIWNERNERFLFNLVKEFISGKNDIVLSKQFVMTLDGRKMTKTLQEMNSRTCEFVAHDRNGIPINIVLEHLSNEFDNNLDQDFDLDKLMTADVLEFLAITFENFYVKDSLVYNEMIFQMRFGKKLDSVIVSTLKFLGEPIHFKQLAAYIRETNVIHSDVPEGSVHGMLQKNAEVLIVGAGTYSYKKDDIEEYRSTPVLIFELLKECGPLLESQIIKRLPEVEVNTIKLSLKNHTNKHFIRIGNDLYDIKYENGNDWN
jgi:hypothetical protein